MASRRRALIIVLACALFAMNTIRYAGHQLDDTFISFRYARNLAEGRGLVFNPGERVEGYTNFLFVLAAALFLAIGLDPLMGSGALVFIAALLTLYVTDRLDRGPPRERRGLDAFPLAVCLLLPLEPFAYWSVVSLETMLFAFLLILGIHLTHREVEKGKGLLSALVFILLSLTRPEGALCFAVIWPVSLLLARRKSRTWSHAGRFILKAAIYAAGLGIYLGWRLSYYGSLLPNTYRAKVTWGTGQMETGQTYLLDWIGVFPLAAAALAAPLLLLPWLARRGGIRALIPDDSPLHLVYPPAFIYLAYTILVGGDHMPFYRFSVLILPLLCLAASGIVRGLVRLFPRPHPAARIAFVLLVLVHASASYFTIQGYRAFVAHRTAVVGEATGRWFGSQLEAGDLMAVNTVGALPYHSRLRTIDMLGLTDAAIASRPVYVDSPGWAGHRRGWGSYVLDNQPRAIVWYNSAGSSSPYYLGDRELAADPYFRFFYRLRRERLPPLDHGEGRVLRRFAGYPFGYSDTGVVVSGDLGLRAILRTNPFDYTAFKEGAIVLTWFEKDPRDEALWPIRKRAGREIDRFVDRVVARWQRRKAPPQPADPEAAARVERMLEEAYSSVQTGHMDRARKVLAEAAVINQKVRSPVVYQYIANVAVETGDLWAALPAQKEALRLAPDNPLYVANLKRLLVRPAPEPARP